MERNRRRRPSRMQRMMPMLTAWGLILIILAVTGVQIYIEKYAPSDELADQAEYFGVSGSDTVIYLNEQKQQDADGNLITAVFDQGSVYLPASWVRQNLNRRFYWAEDQEAVLYTLPTETIKSGADATAEDGGAVYLQRQEGLFLNVSYVKEYTDIRYYSYTDGEYKRIFIYNDWSPALRSEVKEDAPVRVLGGVKSPILTTAEGGSKIKVLEQMEKWSKVSTNDGYIGYVQNKYLNDPVSAEAESDFIEPEYTHLTLPDGEKVVLGFHQIMNRQANAGFEDAVADAEGMNVVAPTWFSLSDESGGYVSYADTAYVEKAHAAGLQVWATVNNFDQGDIDETVLFSSSSSRAELIRGLTQEALSLGLDGLNIDFELVPESAGSDYVQFMRELSVVCRNQGLILSVDTYVPYSYNRYYDIEELGTFCDYVIIMCYDEHYAGSEAGSVASLGYLRDGLSGGLAKVAADQLVIAIPFYTRIWTVNGDETSSDAMGMEEAQKWLDERAVKLTWDEATGQNYGQIVDEKGTRKVWMEDEDSIQKKMELIRDAEIGGVACWKLTQEPASIWKLVNLNQAAGGNEN